MPKSAPRETNPIKKLLEDRAQFTSWLARLDATGDAVPSVPEAVRLRVRTDYEARLTAVIDELRSHAASIEEQLEEFRARRFELTHRETDAKEAMAEAEVRHAVGEYDEARWQSIRADSTRILVTVREELARTNTEIDRLIEVQSLISAPAPVAEPEPEAALAPAAPVREGPKHTPPPELPLLINEPEIEEAAASGMPSDVEPSPGIRRQVPKPAPKPRDEPPARTEWIPSDKPAHSPAAKLDELAFLKSVASDRPAAPKRQSGGFSRTAEPTPPTPPAPPAPAAPMGGITTADPFISKSQPAVDPGKEHRPSHGNAPKTLKCGDCGTLNRPTEWYCERCGAELAAL